MMSEKEEEAPTEEETQASKFKAFWEKLMFSVMDVDQGIVSLLLIWPYTCCIFFSTANSQPFKLIRFRNNCLTSFCRSFTAILSNDFLVGCKHNRYMWVIFLLYFSSNMYLYMFSWRA